MLGRICLYYIYDVSIYVEEFADYEDGEDSFWMYYTQRIESHAREAAEKNSLVYIKAINEYLGIELDVNIGKFTGVHEYIDYILWVDSGKEGTYVW